MNEDNYDDIINLDRHISKKHKPMSIEARAAAFAPFAALKGHASSVRENARIVDEKLSLSSDASVEINNKLLFIEDNLDKKLQITLNYFIKDKRKNGGAYQQLSGVVVKINHEQLNITMSSGEIINIDDIFDISAEVFDNMHLGL